MQKTIDTPLLEDNDSGHPRSSARSILLTRSSQAITLPFPHKRKSIWEDLPDREIKFNENSQMFKNNKINTSKYTCLTFVPKNFLEQFSKLANIYFLLIGFFQMIGEISTSGGIPVIFFPLTIILIVSGVKDLFEDLKRKKSDTQENNREILVLEDGEFRRKIWQDLRVGNLVKIRENEFFPADMLLLSSSDPKNVCYIETKNLDGETNLKRKAVAKNLSFIKNLSEKEIWKIEGRFNYEKPNPFLYNFKGNIEHGDSMKIPLDNVNFVLRGCSLRNTHYIIGIIAYTGHETKIMLNSTKARAKNSKIERAMNKQIVIVFLFQLIFCLFSSLYGAIWYSNHFSELSYLLIDPEQTVDNSFAYNLIVRYGNWLIIFQNFVPISLMVTLEMVKFIQGIFISNDVKMRTKETETMPSVHTSTLNEELGQVEYIFSDKTGTLTCNFMEFKKVSIAGETYGEEQSLSPEEVNALPKVTNVDFKDKEFFEKIKQGDKAIEETLFGIALCHTIIVEINEEGKVVYNASSPDELALLNWARYCGCMFLGVDQDNFAKVEFKGKIHRFEVLQVLEFNSARKRQSVIVRNQDNEIVLYTKGADSVIEERLTEREKNAIIKEQTWKNLENYANTGLRTLVLASRKIEAAEYSSWAVKYQEASASLVMREEKMEELQNDIEVEFELLCATAIEDKLQDDVGGAIISLKEAGIKFWVLTGDKIETAINIGYSCKLLNNKLQKIIIDGKDSQEVEKFLDEKLSSIKSNNRRNLALVISGDALIHCTKGSSATKFVRLSEHCSAVIACRVSPKQKQEIVSLIKLHKPNSTTLAIGDGANDVNMITAAHVGVGIRGVEGQQAARASDYVIGEFKFLRRIILYYGRESYRRNSHLICYNFFKNMVLVLPQFWYGFFNGFSGQNIYNPFLYQLFNIFHASIPICIYGVLDKEYSGHFLMDNPSLYYIGLRNKIFNVVNFWMWILFGVWQSFLITFFSFNVMEFNFIDSEEGYMYVFWGTGMIIYGAVIVNTNLKVMVFSHTHTLLSAIIIVISVGSYYWFFEVTSQNLSQFGDYLCSERMWNSGNFYLLMILIVVSTTFFDLACERFKHLANKYLLIEEEEDKKEIELAEYQSLTKSENTGYAYSQDEPKDQYYDFAEN